MTVGPVLPGGTIGVLGGGQLGRMMALAARRMGYRIVVLDPNPRCPTAQVSDGVVVGALDDVESAMHLAKQVDVVTLDTEHVPAEVLDAIAKVAPVRPGPSVLRTIQDRQVQKQFLDRLGIAQAAWLPVDGSLEQAVARLGGHAIVKHRRAGYDGKGQMRIDLPAHSLSGSAMRPGDPWKSPTTLGSPRRPLEVPDDPWKSPTGDGGRGTGDGGRGTGDGGRGTGRTTGAIEAVDQCAAATAWLRNTPAVVEQVVPFVREISAIIARSVDGEVRSFPTAENVHRKHVLHTTRAPATLTVESSRRIAEIVSAIAEALDHVGVLAVEMFELADGQLLVNEIAPRTHNSGHYTWGACATSQFEQHVRAICGLRLGDPRALSGAVMVNLIGDLWAKGQPQWRHVLERPDAKLHIYGKELPAPGRKMGHILILDDDTDRGLVTAEQLIQSLPVA